MRRIAPIKSAGKITVSQNYRSWRDRVRDIAFTTMLVVQCLIIFAAPIAAMGYEIADELEQLLFFAFTVLVYLIARGSIATIFAIISFISILLGYVLLQLPEISSGIPLALGYGGGIGAFVVALYALGHAALAPGVVTVHRVLGAIALYLNIGLMFGVLYRLIWYFVPNSLTNIPGDVGWQAYSTIIYFSFVTLTSTGFGDVVPIHPLVRSLVNVEAIIGQLYPATLLARLVSLEIRGELRRRRS